MNIRNLQELDREMLHSDFEIGKTLFETMKRQGYSPVKAMAMTYRHGYLDGEIHGVELAMDNLVDSKLDDIPGVSGNERR